MADQEPGPDARVRLDIDGPIAVITNDHADKHNAFDDAMDQRLFEILGLTSGLPPVDLTRIKPDPQAVEALPQEMCTEHCVLPIARNGDNLTVAISDPFDVLLLDDL